MPAAAPRVTAQDATSCEVQPLEGAVLLERLNSIGRAARREATHRRQYRRDTALVEVNRQKKKPHYQPREKSHRRKGKNKRERSGRAQASS